MYPPVDTEFFQADPAEPPSSTGGALIVSALVPYKRIDVAIDACREAGLPLTIVGDGPERAALERAAGSTVRFAGRLPDEAIRDAYRRAAVVLLPGEEDFGIVPVEAQACGTPVVALARGGATETVIAGETGVLVEELSSAALADGIRRALGRTFDRRAIRAHAERFSRRRFANEIEALVAETLSPADAATAEPAGW